MRRLRMRSTSDVPWLNQGGQDLLRDLRRAFESEVGHLRSRDIRPWSRTSEPVEDISPSVHHPRRCLIDASVVHIAFIPIEHGPANDLLARSALGGSERSQRCFECGIGADGKCHPAMVSLWYRPDLRGGSW